MAPKLAPRGSNTRTLNRRTPGITAVFAAAAALLIAIAPVSAASSGSVTIGSAITNGRIAFCDFGSGNGCVVSTMNPDGSDEQQLTSGQAPNWSPDGTRIAFQDGARRSDQVFTINADGTGRQQVTTLDGDNVYPSWSPDGSLLLFIHYPRAGCCANIFTVRANGSGLHKVTDLGDVGPAEPEFSPDGQSIAFWEQNAGGGNLAAIFVMRADGSNIRQVTPLSLDADHPEWSPDGSKLIFNNDASQNIGDIFTIRPDGTGLNRLTNVIPLGWVDYRPAYSPDGTMVVFNQQIPGQNPVVMTMKSNGGSQQTINTTGFGPDWGP